MLFNVAVNMEMGEEKETFAKEPNEKTIVETENVEDSCQEDTKLSLPLSVSPPPAVEIACVSKETTGSSILIAAGEPHESMLNVSLKCVDQKPEVGKLFSDRKLIVIRTADIQRSRSADIFRSDNVAATSGPATARAQSETRDVTNFWNALSKTEQTLAVENLSSLVCTVVFSY